MPEVLEKMREMFYVYTPSGDKGYMRFYDPSVFRDYVAQKDDNIQYALFNQITCYWCEAPSNTDIVYQYIKESTSVHKKKSIDLKQKERETDA